jgi:hypothetical protein
MHDLIWYTIGIFWWNEPRSSSSLCGRCCNIFKKNHYIHIRHASSRVKNNRYEFISLRTVLEMARKNGGVQVRLQVSHQIAIQKYSMEGVRPSPLFQDTLIHFQCFEWPSFNQIQIYENLNMKADELLNEALCWLVKAFGFYEYLDGEEVESMDF